MRNQTSCARLFVQTAVRDSRPVGLASPFAKASDFAKASSDKSEDESEAALHRRRGFTLYLSPLTLLPLCVRFSSAFYWGRVKQKVVPAPGLGFAKS